MARKLIVSSLILFAVVVTGCGGGEDPISAKEVPLVGLCQDFQPEDEWCQNIPPLIVPESAREITRPQATDATMIAFEIPDMSAREISDFYKEQMPAKESYAGWLWCDIKTIPRKGDGSGLYAKGEPLEFVVRGWFSTSENRDPDNAVFSVTTVESEEGPQAVSPALVEDGYDPEDCDQGTN